MMIKCCLRILPLCTERDPNAGRAGVTVAMDLLVALVNVGRGLVVADIVVAAVLRMEAEVVFVLPLRDEVDVTVSEADPRNK